MACSKRHFSQSTSTQERVQKKIESEVSEKESKERLKTWKPPLSTAKKGILKLYQKHVQSAASAAIKD
jgi:dihydroxyacid dehydratase/phosphogluconate dehydratase